MGDNQNKDNQYVVIPAFVWQTLVEKINSIDKMLRPLAKGYRDPQWIEAADAMEMLNIKKDRLSQIRASGAIRLRKPANGKHILYYFKDVDAYQKGILILPKKEKLNRQ